MKALKVISSVLIIVGGLNWLLVAFNFNLVEALLGVKTVATNVVYIVVGLAALVELVGLFSKKDSAAM
ncbi:DUF378 domain-containing protein [Candidatus Nomurabacteria bacterium]|nr:DUF378 domain-containing protein [Candidatus Nomurabacteria bacterium]